jgi:hypothetical protein
VFGGKEDDGFVQVHYLSGLSLGLDLVLVVASTDPREPVSERNPHCDTTR